MDASKEIIFEMIETKEGICFLWVQGFSNGEFTGFFKIYC